MSALSPDKFEMVDLAGEPVSAKLVNAPDNGAPIGGLKAGTESGWFAARPSGTANTYKVYAESSRDEAHLRQIEREAQDAIDRVLGSKTGDVIVLYLTLVATRAQARRPAWPRGRLACFTLNAEILVRPTPWFRNLHSNACRTD